MKTQKDENKKDEIIMIACFAPIFLLSVVITVITVIDIIF